ncbi:MAG: nucleotidyltransferase domain-containing protein, partial [Cyanobacteriota bacterium]|nr:nucleotidyltransferase domain-containing protein [Cyanobacteriota bacterium]
PKFIPHIINRLKSISGVKAIALGGSRAKGNHNSMSDVDLGLYYSEENPIDVNALNQLASEIDDSHQINLVTQIGDWRRWFYSQLMKNIY